MINKLFLRLGTGLLYVWAALFSCNPPPAPTTYTATYVWKYDCAANGSPQSFEYGVRLNGAATLTPLGTLTVTSCTTAQSFTAKYTSSAIPAASDIYYVRAVFPGPVYSNPDFYPTVSIQRNN